MVQKIIYQAKHMYKTFLKEISYLKPKTIQDGRLSVISQGNAYLRPITYKNISQGNVLLKADDHSRW